MCPQCVYERYAMTAATAAADVELKTENKKRTKNKTENKREIRSRVECPNDRTRLSPGKFGPTIIIIITRYAQRPDTGVEWTDLVPKSSSRPEI